MELSFAAATDLGRQRKLNEDNFLIDKKLRLFVVADGMGGHAAGEVASSVTVHEIREAVLAQRDRIDRFRVGSGDTSTSDVLEALERALHRACAAVYERAQVDATKRGMGTTATALLIAGSPDKPRGFIAHVGDSRCYLIRQKQCHVLTEDHSLVNELLKRGKVTKEQLATPQYKQLKNAVTRAIGVHESVAVDTFDFDIVPGDQFLLCSDGLYAYLDDDKLRAAFDTQDPNQIPAELIRIANDGGGHDNITSVVIRVGDANTATPQARALARKLDVFKSMSLFRFLTYKELNLVSNLASIVELSAQEILFEEGSAGDSLYAVLAGSLRMTRGGETVTTLSRGQHLGEMALIDKSIRSLTATATEPTQLVAIHRAEFYDLVKNDTQLSAKILWSFVQTLGNRLRRTNMDLIEAVGDDLADHIATRQNLLQD
jgi:PPM family protein phosphatase